MAQAQIFHGHLPRLQHSGQWSSPRLGEVSRLRVECRLIGRRVNAGIAWLCSADAFGSFEEYKVPKRKLHYGYEG